MKEYGVLVVDDSAFMRKIITDILESDERISVIGTARNGRDALNKIQDLSPDVVTLDIEMPVMDGLTALKRIMDTKLLPVVMLSSLTKTGAENTVKAMELGAVDFIAKPSGSISLDIKKVESEIIEKVLTAAKANLVNPSGGNNNRSNKQQPMEKAHFSICKEKYLVAIGTSTGGPRALQQVLIRLPKNFPAPIVIVQHMPPGFTKSLADRLDSFSEIHVKEAVTGEILKAGTAYIAPGNHHMRIKKIGRGIATDLAQDEQRNGHRPSVDVLFESLTVHREYKKLAVVMTGMGADGTRGLQLLKQVDENVTVISEQIGRAHV